MKRDVDMDVLDELVGLCEDAIVRPFKKAKPASKPKPATHNNDSDLTDEDLALLEG